MDQLTFEYTRRDGAKSRSEVAAARSSLTPGVKLALNFLTELRTVYFIPSGDSCKHHQIVFSFNIS